MSQSYPLAVQTLGGDGSGGAPREYVQHHIAGVAAGLDDALVQFQGFLGGVAGVFPCLGTVIREPDWVEYQVLRRIASVSPSVPFQSGPPTPLGMINQPRFVKSIKSVMDTLYREVAGE